MQQSEWENSCHRIGTCALTGSAALFASIPGSYVIVNGPLWCYFYAMKYIDDSMPGAAERFYPAFTTSLKPFDLSLLT